MFRKKFFTRVFEREWKFLIDFFNPSSSNRLKGCGNFSAKRKHFLRLAKPIHAALQRLERPMIQKCIATYQRMQFCEHMILVSQHQRRNLAARIQLNQLTLEAK